MKSENQRTEPPSDDPLTEEERDAFERLAEKFAGEDVGKIAETVLQSVDSESDSEATSS